MSDGVTHVFSVVDRHESNEAERVIQEVFRQISAMVNEERVAEDWFNSEYILCLHLFAHSTMLVSSSI